MQRTFKYRLYPNRKQRETLAAQLDLCRELYNAALQERIESYKTPRKGVTWLEQQAQLPAIKEVRPEFKSVHAHTLQAVLIRLNRSFQNFFRRVKKNESPGSRDSKGATVSTVCYSRPQHSRCKATMWRSPRLATSRLRCTVGCPRNTGRCSSNRSVDRGMRAFPAQ